MKKIISLLIVLAMLMTMAPMVFAAETDEYQEVTIPAAIELAMENEDTLYLVRGIVAELVSANSMYIVDANGNALYIAVANGEIPQVGEEVLLLGKLTTNNGEAQMVEATIQTVEAGGEIPEGGIELTQGTTRLSAGYKDENWNTYPEVKEYYYVAEQTGTLYITFLTLGYGDFDAGEGMLDNTNWVKLAINGELVTSFNNSLEVQAGDLVSISIESVDGDSYFSHVNLNYEGPYVSPVGSEMNPAKLYYADCPTTTIEIGAGEEAFYELDYEFYGYTLRIYGEDAYVVYEAWDSDVGARVEKYLYAVDGIVYYPVEAYEIRIGNQGDEAASFEVDTYVPLGSELNPDELSVGIHEVVMVEDCWYYFTTTATTDGTLTLTLTGDSFWQMEVRNMNNPDDYMDNETFYIEEMDPETGNVLELEVTAGDEIRVVLKLVDAEWNYIAGNLTLDVAFTAAGEEGGEEGGEESTNELGDVNGDGFVDVEDAMLILQLDAFIIEEDELDMDVADVSGDGFVDVEDAMLILQFDAFLIEKFPAEDENTEVEGEELELGFNEVEVADDQVVDYTWTATEDGLFVLSVMSENWAYTINGVTRTSADETPVYVTVLKVSAGDVVTLSVGTADGTAGVVGFNAATYAGTAADPVYLPVRWNDMNTVGVLNAELPAGEYVYSVDLFTPSLELTINGERAEVAMDPMGMDPATVVINNEGETGAVYEIKLAPPAGTMYNPDPMEQGVNVADMIFADYQMMHCYYFTAEEDTLLALNMMGDNWYYWGIHMDANGNMDFSSMTMTYSALDEVVVSSMIVKVEAGQTFMLVVGTVDGSDRVTFGALPAAGTAEDPAMLQMIWNDANTAASLNVDLPAGEYVYGLPIFGASVLELTINGEPTNYDADPMGWIAATVVINNESDTSAVYSIEIAPPSGTMYNPDPLEMGYNEAELIYADYQMMRCFAFTAEEDTLLSLSMMGDNWYFWGMMQDANGTTTAWIDGHDAETDPMVTMQVIKVAAGETFVLILGTIDGSDTVAFNARVNAGTEADPVSLEMIWNTSQTAASLNADLPAGEYVYSLPIFGAGSLELTINGVKTEFNADPMGFDPSTVVINNETGANAVYSIKVAPPAGTMYNPDPLEMGYNEAELIYADYQMMRCFAFTAEEDTLLALTMMGDNWYFWGMMQDANGMTTAWIDGHDAETDPMVTMQVIKVAAGETFVLILGTIDGSDTVAFNAMTYAGTEEDPIMVEFNWDEETWSSATLNIDIPAGEYVFGTRGLIGTVLTANGEEIDYVVSGSMRNPDLFMLTNDGESSAIFELALSYPPAAPGTLDNPEVIELGEHTVEVGADNMDGHYFSWTAEEDGTLTIVISSEMNWYLMAWNNGNFDYEGIDHWSGDHPGEDTFTIEVKAGDEIIIVVNVYDDENGLQVAGEVTVALSFEP